MSFTRTVTVIDHEVVVRTIEVPDEAAAQAFTAITGGRRTAAFTTAGGLFAIAVAIMPAVTAAFH